MKEEQSTDKILMVKGKPLCVKKRSYVGTVVSTKMQKTVTVEWERKVFIPKYERYLKRRTRVKAHQPDSIAVEEGDRVRIFACRPLSKTVNFVVKENLGKERHYLVTKEGREEGHATFDKEEAPEQEKPIEESSVEKETPKEEEKEQ